MGDRLDDAVRAAFPARTVEAVEEQETRPGNATALVTFADGRTVFLKTATDGRCRLVRETAATRYAATHCSIGTPAVVAADPHGDPPYLATEPLAGIALAEPWGDADHDARVRLLRRAGRTIADVHDARFDRPGRIVGGTADGLELAVDTWPETLAATVEERAADLFADRFDGMPGRLVETVREAAPLLEGASATLLHGDPTRTNCRLDPPGLLDWERALVGDPALDLVDAVGYLVDQVDVDEDDRAELTHALHDGYRERAGSLPDDLDRRRPLYSAVAFLLTPQTFELWTPQVDQPTEELAAWVREEFDSRLARARETVT
jgi:aminoglycoside phosphotransferase (APT) family kinase protein